MWKRGFQQSPTVNAGTALIGPNLSRINIVSKIGNTAKYSRSSSFVSVAVFTRSLVDDDGDQYAHALNK